MAENKKISELHTIVQLHDDDEFVIIDKSTKTGADASGSGKTTKLKVWQLKQELVTSGEKGQKGSTGPEGPQGSNGANGRDGRDGVDGQKGEPGARGQDGVVGRDGIDGTNGAKGDKGQQGERGIDGNASDGVKGEQGQKGEPGAPGADGARGRDGVNGDDGAKGQKGNVGQQGSQGVPGTPGKSGEKGAPGVNGSSGGKGQKGTTGESGVFAGGTITSPTTIKSSNDQKLILEGSERPYIRFREGTTDKAYIQWNDNGQLYLTNQETNTSCTVANDRFTINSRYGYTQIGAMNTSWSHFYTDRPAYYFNKTIYVDGEIKQYNTNKTYLHTGNVKLVFGAEKTMEWSKCSASGWQGVKLSGNNVVTGVHVAAQTGHCGRLSNGVKIFYKSLTIST